MPFWNKKQQDYIDRVERREQLREERAARKRMRQEEKEREREEKRNRSREDD